MRISFVPAITKQVECWYHYYYKNNTLEQPIGRNHTLYIYDHNETTMRYAGYDLFQKQVDGLRTKTITGAIISIVAASVTFVLFLSQVYLYFELNVSDHLTIAVPDRFRSLEALIANRAHPSLLLNVDGRGKFRNASPIILHLHVTFPHIKCQDLDIFHNGASGEDFRRMHGKNAVTFRAPNKEELLKVALDTKAEDGCTIQGKFAVPKVSGSFGVSVARSSWQVILMNAMFHMTQRHQKNDKKAYDPFAGGSSQTGKSFNVTHYIHTVDFGKTAVFSHHPLRDVREVVSNQSGLGGKI